jgi:Circularly permutated YpsA SLOG family
MPLTTVISGGQTGVDQAALRAALHCGLTCGGWCPPGRACESGTIPLEFPLRETPSDRSPEAPNVPRSLRTEWNVRDSDATLILRPRGTDAADPGTGWTDRCVTRYGRHLLICDPRDPDCCRTVLQWLDALSIRTLNVAGPSEQRAPGIGDDSYRVLTSVFAARR